ncbi:hypothetical protein I215_12388 [Galbibacter marinus]|uniref:Oligosaccharide repeat unit polymerase n=1 Tax=Galbibacter marinus TaxID=555500 RepID=K2P058_9FLAO|nr:O-antigen polymerase [Galbibacter marinus]EKF54428.1 hypothetical protein I215_12388 [Galbibacter marinus]
MKVYSPRNAAIYGILIWILFYLISPISYSYPISSVSIILLLGSYLLFFLGYSIGSKVKHLRIISTNSRRNSIKLYYIFLGISVLSVLCLFIDSFVIRGININNGAFENREILENSTPSIIGIFGNIIKASVFLNFFLYFQHNFRKPYLLYANYALIMYFIFESFLTGSRSIPFFYVILIILILFHFKIIQLKIKYLFYLGILGILFFILLTETFISRTIEFTGTREQAIIFILKKGTYLDYTKIDESFLSFVISIDSYYLQSFFVGLASFYGYYLHSIVEFSYLIDHFDSPARLGSHTFFVIAKFFKIIFGGGYELTLNYVPRPGKYTTFFGDIFMDFKYYTPFFMMLFGYWQSRLYKSVIAKNNYTIIPLILFLCILNFIFPVFNLITGGKGIYLIIGLILLSYMYRFLTQIKS